MNRILITGGSGFIGTNLINKLINDNKYDILSIDVEEPKIELHKKFWKQVDINDKLKLQETVADFNPEWVIHLAARTDLRGASIESYDSNIGGVRNLIDCLKKCLNLKRVIFTSSMYVCQPGYTPISFDDYHPHTFYGQSKVLTEKIIKDENPANYEWCIIRPTSIWGPWFGEPYADFFHIVMGHKYFHMGKRACTKTYGYIENTLFQLEALLITPVENIQGQVFYIGDWPAYDISEWANEIASYINIKIPRVPFFAFQVMGWFGDFLKVLGIKFPMTSFRLRNMTTNNIHNLDPIKKIANDLPYSRIEGVKKTVDWILATK